MTESLKQEQLRRIEREVRKAIPYYADKFNIPKDDYHKLIGVISTDAEVLPEIERLIEIIIEEQ
jgi:hypothetical protein